MIGCSSLPEWAAPKILDEYNAEMADFIPYRKLERADFKAKQPPPEYSEHSELMAAVICVYIEPIFDLDAVDLQLSDSPNEDKVYRITYKNLRYRALMDRNCSWWNLETVATEKSYILEHEQIHFALMELEARRWHESTTIQLNLKLGSPEAMAESKKKQFDRYLEKRLEPIMAQDRKFDEETSVVRDSDKQKQWWNLVQSQLSNTASVATPPDTELVEAAPVESEEVSKYGDYARILNLFEPLAEQGHIEPQYALGHMYSDGKGVTQDYEAAAKWYKLAAEQGHAKAQIALGLMYYYGIGVIQDYEAAAKWYRLAAEQGDASAQLNLGEIYLKGQGVTQDYTRAYMWWEIAASQGDENAVKNSEKNQELLIPSQLEKVQLLARECVASNYKNC